jgi:putative sterol carrier protein
MSQLLDSAVKALNDRLNGGGIEGSVRFEIDGEGSVRIDEKGAAVDDSPADCTMSASPETFRGLLEGDVDPTSAFMGGQLRIEGDMGLALKLGSVLA